MASVYTKPGVLHVLGRTRVGKGEFVATALRNATGQVVNISKAGSVSHTRKSHGYNMQLGERAVQLYDTVGYDDTNSAHLDVQRFVQMLEETKENPFYPPMVLIQSLGATDAEWLRRLRAVFPRIAVAVRGSKETYEETIQELTDQNIDPLRVFHLQEYTNVDGGVSRAIYERCVGDVVHYYETINPSRDGLDFDAEFLQGEEAKETVDLEERVEIRKSEKAFTLEEDTVIRVSKQYDLATGTGHYERFDVEPAAEQRSGLASFFDRRRRNTGQTSAATQQFWVPDIRQVVMASEDIRPRRVPVKQITTKEYTYHRYRYKIWRILPGGMRIFEREDVGEWTLFNVEETDVQIVRISDAPKAH